MAARKTKEKEQTADYQQEIRRLHGEGAKNLYLIWGPEDYLRQLYVEELKKSCVGDDDSGFGCYRFQGPEIDLTELRIAMDSMPFLSERSYVEISDADLNHLKNGEELLELLKDIPDYCTLVFVQSGNFEPDARLKLTKKLQDKGIALKFSAQGQQKLIKWIVNRFGAYGKSIELEAASRLIFYSGELMSELIPQIEKISAAVAGSEITKIHIEQLADRKTEAEVFNLSEHLGNGDYKLAMKTLSDLLNGKDNDPIFLLAVIASQLRKLYTASLLCRDPNPEQSLMDMGAERFREAAGRTLRLARRFSKDTLAEGIRLCAEADYRMKSSGEEPKELIKETVARIAALSIKA